MARLIACGCVVAILASLGVAAPPAATPVPQRIERPNILFILADDLGYGDLGCYGQKQILTPNIDRLAERGMRFTQFYAGCTVCAPSRCCLMTGLHTGHAYIRGNSGKNGARVPLRPDDVTVAEVLKTVGYRTGIIGKWGLGEPDTTGIPNRQGFDYWFGYLNQAHAHDYYTDYLWRNEERYELPGNRDGKREQYSHDLFTREALAFIKADPDKPFFLYLAYTIPHAKLEVPDDAPYSDKPWPTPQKNYAAMITRMDRDIGRIVELLDKLGMTQRTLVFFTSDNGATSEGGGEASFFKSNAPLRGIKRDLYEGGIRVPMIAVWPGKIRAGTTSDQVWAMWDFLPTVADITGAKAPSGLDGISMRNALLGLPQKNHDYLYWEFHERGGAQAVRMGDYKAVIKKAGAPIELYDLKTDIGESKDIAAAKPDLVRRAEELFRTARTESEHWPMAKPTTAPSR